MSFETPLFVCFCLDTFTDLKSLRNACMDDIFCKPKAKNCLLSELQGSAFSNCPLQRTYIKSIDRMFR